MTTRKSASAAAFYRGAVAAALVEEVNHAPLWGRLGCCCVRARRQTARAARPIFAPPESVRRSRVRYARSVCMASKNKQHIKVCRSQATLGPAAARAERAAVRQSQEQSNRFSLQLCVEFFQTLFSVSPAPKKLQTRCFSVLVAAVHSPTREKQAASAALLAVARSQAPQQPGAHAQSAPSGERIQGVLAACGSCSRCR